ncbi:calcium-responsive transcription factor isoform X2 [Centroberyx gerrardi]
MECQYGPRRKGLQPKKNSEQPQLQDYKATCPARIYIKKVRKFPEFRVPSEPTADRKTVRQEQEKAFCSLRSQTLSTGGAVRYYLQLPTEKAHLYHDVATPIPPPPPDLLPPAQLEEEEETEEEGGEEGEEEAGDEDSSLIPSRLHPRVAERIRQLVAEGQHQVYSVRKQLRRFVERELFKCEGLPERHNLCYFPTVNDIKNHIHESQKALGLTGATAEYWMVVTLYLLRPFSSSVLSLLCSQRSSPSCRESSCSLSHRLSLRHRNLPSPLPPLLPPPSLSPPPAPPPLRSLTPPSLLLNPCSSSPPPPPPPRSTRLLTSLPPSRSSSPPVRRGSPRRRAAPRRSSARGRRSACLPWVTEERTTSSWRTETPSQFRSSSLPPSL